MEGPAGCLNAQVDVKHPDTLDYPAGNIKPKHTPLQQLRQYPLPRYAKGYKLERLFDWMDPYYLGGMGIVGTPRQTVIRNAVDIQTELIRNWNYGIVIPNSLTAFNDACGADTCCPEFLRLANAYPNIPLHVITFWMASNSKLIGRNHQGSMILDKDLPPSLYIDFNFYGTPKREIKFNFPDSLARVDGMVQKKLLERMVKCLHRPINVINEDGEEPPGPYLLDAIKRDKQMIRMKDSMKINSWEDFMAIRKLQLRNSYSSVFMKGIPELKNTRFSMYTVEAGPVDRFEWSIMRKCVSPLNGMYYSTPDFYPRWPCNWKDWKGPWHGWSWVESGRKIEIRTGDNLFSPFVCAGWSKKPEEDIRPGQWLGLLKCLGTIGAEYYYVGYFNLGAPFADPGTYIWQAAMPAYAQAITSRYEDVLRDGHLLKDENGDAKVSYKTDDKHVLLTLRKHNKKEKYIICGTYQSFTNEKDEIPEKKTISLKVDDHVLTFEVRRQGSVYVYEKLPDGRAIFYQLDGWHERTHPERWSKDYVQEAELCDSPLQTEEIMTESKGDDYSAFCSYVPLKPGKDYEFKIIRRDSVSGPEYAWIRYKGKGSLSLEVTFPGGKNDPGNKIVPLATSTVWTWHKIQLPALKPGCQEEVIKVKVSQEGINLDKIVLSSKSKADWP